MLKESKRKMSKSVFKKSIAKTKKIITNKTTLWLTLSVVFVMLFASSAIFALDSSGVYFEKQEYVVDLNNNIVDVNVIIINNQKDPSVFGYFTFYSTLLFDEAQIFVNGNMVDTKHVRMDYHSRSGNNSYTTITYDHLWDPLPTGQSMNISLKYKTNFNAQGVLFKEIEFVPGKFSFKDFSNLPVKARALTIKTPQPIIYSNYPEFEVSSSPTSISWQDDGSQRQYAYAVEYSAIPFFKNHAFPVYFIFWTCLLFVIIAGIYVYEKRQQPKDFVDAVVRKNNLSTNEEFVDVEALKPLKNLKKETSKKRK